MTRRWAKPNVPRPLPPVECTLFGGAFSDDLDYAEIGVRPPEVTSEGVSVKLGAAATALGNIMTTYNQLNKTMGARMQNEQRQSNDFTARYSMEDSYEGPEKMIERMGYKATRMLVANEKDFAVLNRTDALVTAGFSKSDAETSARKAKSSLVNKYGPGVAYAKDRDTMVRRIRKIAGKTS